MQSWTRFAFLQVFVNIVGARDLTDYARKASNELMQHLDALIADGAMRLLKLLKNAPYNKDGAAHYWLFRKSG